MSTTTWPGHLIVIGYGKERVGHVWAPACCTLPALSSRPIGWTLLPWHSILMINPATLGWGKGSCIQLPLVIQGTLQHHSSIAEEGNCQGGRSTRGSPSQPPFRLDQPFLEAASPSTMSSAERSTRNLPCKGVLSDRPRHAQGGPSRCEAWVAR